MLQTPRGPEAVVRVEKIQAAGAFHVVVEDVGVEDREASSGRVPEIELVGPDAEATDGQKVRMPVEKVGREP